MKDPFFQSLPKPLLFAHRGASGEYPQNTLLAFDMAIKQGAVGIETDLHITKDRQIVCFHDPELGRLSTLAGLIRDKTRSELSAARVKHAVFGNETIPTLVDLLEWLPAENYLFLELKDRQFALPQHMELLLNLLAKYNVLHKIILSSFSTENIDRARRLLPSIPTCHITLWNPSTRIDADVLSPYYPILWLNPFYAKNAHRSHRAVAVWDPYPEKRIQYYLDQQVDILTADNPEKVRAALQEHQPQPG